MRCAICGGTIHVDEACEDCGIKYMDMLNNIKHPEMKSLFKKIKDLEEHHQNIDIEASLLACELENSSFIIPAVLGDDSLGLLYLPDQDDKRHLTIFTDMSEFEFFKDQFTPLTNSWDMVLMMVEEWCDGIVIDVCSDICVLSRAFLEQFFADKLPSNK